MRERRDLLMLAAAASPVLLPTRRPLRTARTAAARSGKGSRIESLRKVFGAIIRPTVHASKTLAVIYTAPSAFEARANFPHVFVGFQMRRVAAWTVRAPDRAA